MTTELTTPDVGLSERFRILARTIRTTRPGYILPILKRWNLILMWRSASEIAGLAFPTLYKDPAAHAAFVDHRARLFTTFGVTLGLMSKEEQEALLTELPQVTYDGVRPAIKFEPDLQGVPV